MPPALLPPWTKDVRNWQENTHGHYLQVLPPDCLIVAVPGAGKTLLANRVLHSLLTQGLVDHGLVLCPSKHLVSQWIDSAHENGSIELCPLDSTRILEGADPDHYHGHVATYHAMTSHLGQAAMEALISKYQGRVMIILDELHHAGIARPWGKALESIFARAAYRLLLSGTPFRTDGTALPFVTYDSQGQCLAFTNYTYGQGLTDQICRRLHFPKFDGQLEYWNGEDTISITFKDEVSEARARERLNAAITSDWLNGVILEAHERLQIIRRHGHADAGGLIVCRDDAHARKVQERVRQLTGCQAVLVTSREEEAHERIEAFTKGQDPWIVAVHMISEGVDIPRLRVGVYATNILTELYFWQFCGRFIRMIDALPCDQDASIYIPSDDVIMAYAARIYQEGERQLREARQAILETMDPDDEGESGYCSPEQQDLLRSRSIYATGTAIPDGAIFLDGEEVTSQEYQWACQTVPPRLQTERSLLAAIYVARSQGTAAAAGPAEPPPSPHAAPPAEALWRQCAQAGREEKSLVDMLHRFLKDRRLIKDQEESNRFFSRLQAELNRLVNVPDKGACGLAQFGTRKAYLLQLLRSGHYDF
jgi:superfamily II DNA or RNA helicase